MVQGSQAIDRAGAILAMVIPAEEPVSFACVVEHTGLARSTASRLLLALEANGLLERDSQGRYRGGALFTGYAARFDRVESLIIAAQPVLERIGQLTGETVNLAVPSGSRVVQIAQVTSTYVLGATNWIDVEVPGHCSALGKVLYAYGVMPLPQGRLERKTPQTLSTQQSLLDDLESVRERGFALVREEFEEGLDAVAAPVREGGSTVVAALGISGPSLRIGSEHHRFGELLMHESQELSAQLRI